MPIDNVISIDSGILEQIATNTANIKISTDSVNLNVELYPSSRDYTAEGYYILKNTKEATIDEVHIQKIIEDNVVINDVSFDGGATINSEYSKYE